MKRIFIHFLTFTFGFRLLFAAPISSPQIGTFFSLPDWMPTEVPSDSTFGSDDATNMTHRIDDVALAAVNACFEAYFERVYFINEGNSNVWDRTKWGSENPDEDFWFLGATNFYTTGQVYYPYRTAFVYDPDTNRSVRTRRFVEYDNIDLLAKVVSGHSAYGRRLNDIFKLRRPYWGGSVMADERNSDYGHALISSTLLDGFGVESPVSFPHVVWSPPDEFIGTLSAREWSMVGRVFGLSFAWNPFPYGVDPDAAIVDWNQRKEPGEYDMPFNFIPTCMLDAINYGEPPFLEGRWLEDELMPSDYYLGSHPEWFITNSVANVIGKGLFVTNVTIEARTSDDIFFSLSSEVLGGMIKTTLREEIADEIAGLVFFLALTNCHVVGTVSLNVTSSWCQAYREGYEEPFAEIGAVFDLNFSSEIRSESMWRFFFEYGGLPGMVPDSESRDNEIRNQSAFGFSCETDAGGSVIGDIEFSIGDDDPIAFLHMEYDAEVTNVEHFVGIEGITNGTRRLVSDRLAGIGRALAAVDRTYYKVDPVYPTDATNVAHSLSMRFEADDIDVSIIWSPGGVGYINGEYEFPPLRQVGEVEVRTNVLHSVTSVSLPYEVRVSQTHTGFQPECYISRDGSQWSYELRLGADEFAEVVGRYLPGQESGAAYVLQPAATVEWHGYVNDVFRVRLSFSVLVVPDESEPTLVEESICSDWVTLPGSAKVHGGASYARDYEYVASVHAGPQFPDGRPTHPGSSRGFSRCREANLWSFRSAAAVWGVDSNHVVGVSEPVSYPGEYSPLGFESLYGSGSASYSSVESCRARVGSSFETMRDEVVSKFIFDHVGTSHFDDPFSVIPVNADDVTGLTIVLGRWASTSLGGYLLGEEWNTGVYRALDTIEYSFEDADLECVSFEYYYFDSGEWVITEPEWPVYCAGLSLSPLEARVKDGKRPSCVESYGVAAGGNLSTWSRVTWKWNALKLERHNQ